jgi:hypothetical protein
MDPKSWSNTKPDFSVEEVYREKRLKPVKSSNSDLYEEAGQRLYYEGLEKKRIKEHSLEK